MLSRKGALGLLHGSLLQEAPQIAVKPLCLVFIRLGDGAEDCGCGSHVLARPSEVRDIVRSVHNVGVDLTLAHGPPVPR